MSRIIRLTILITILAALTAGVWASETAHEAGGSEGNPNIFSGSIAESIWTLLTFGVLVFVLYKLAWGPLLRSLQNREEKIAGEISSAEDARKKAQKVLEEYEEKLASAEKQNREAAAKAIAKAQEKASQVIETAREQSFELKKQAKQDILKAQNSARNELAKEAGVMVLELGSSVLGRVIRKEDNQKLIDEAVEIFDRKKQNGPSA